MKDKVKLADPTRVIEKYTEHDEAFKSVKLKTLKEAWLKAKTLNAKLNVIARVLGLVD